MLYERVRMFPELLRKGWRLCQSEWRFNGLHFIRNDLYLAGFVYLRQVINGPLNLLAIINLVYKVFIKTNNRVRRSKNPDEMIMLKTKHE